MLTIISVSIMNEPYRHSIPTNCIVTISKLTKVKLFNKMSALTNAWKFKLMNRENTVLVPMRATPSERNRIKSHAKRQGLKFSDWMRLAADCQINKDLDAIFFADHVSKNEQSDAPANNDT